MNSFRRFTLLATAFSVLAGGLAGCGGEEEPPINPKRIQLKMYLIGDAPKGMPEVQEALNKKLVADTQTTLDIQYIAWGDQRSKYSLLLAAGQDVDIIYASNWNFYMQEASKGAFKPLSEELIREYLPQHYAQLDPMAWKAAEVNGQIYMIPTATPDKMTGVIVIRKDLREKYGVSPIHRAMELGPYLEAIKQHEPDMIPMNLDSQYDIAVPYLSILREKVPYPGGPIDSGNPSLQGITYDFEDPGGKLHSMVEEPFLSAQKQAAKIMKEWYDNGYINKNPFANQVRSRDSFKEGKSSVAFGNTNDIEPLVEYCESKGMQIDIIPILDPKGKVPAASWLINGLAVAAGSRNTERALQVIDRIMEDPEYIRLVYYGIEGKNYIVTDNGKIGLPPGVTPENQSYPLDRAGFWFVNKNYLKPLTTWPEVYVRHLDDLKDRFIATPYSSFSFNPEKVEKELNAIAKVSAQYASPIYVGAVKDVDQAFAQLVMKLDEAGLRKVKDEAQRQADLFLNQSR